MTDTGSNDREKPSDHQRDKRSFAAKVLDFFIPTAAAGADDLKTLGPEKSSSSSVQAQNIPSDIQEKQEAFELSLARAQLASEHPGANVSCTRTEAEGSVTDICRGTTSQKKDIVVGRQESSDGGLHYIYQSADRNERLIVHQNGDTEYQPAKDYVPNTFDELCSSNNCLGRTNDGSLQPVMLVNGSKEESRRTASEVHNVGDEKGQVLSKLHADKISLESRLAILKEDNEKQSRDILKQAKQQKWSGDAIKQVLSGASHTVRRLEGELEENKLRIAHELRSGMNYASPINNDSLTISREDKTLLELRQSVKDDTAKLADQFSEAIQKSDGNIQVAIASIACDTKMYSKNVQRFLFEKTIKERNPITDAVADAVTFGGTAWLRERVSSSMGLTGTDYSDSGLYQATKLTTEVGEIFTAAAGTGIKVLQTADRVMEARRIGKSLGANPFKGKTFEQIGNRLDNPGGRRVEGFSSRGNDPVNGRGSFLHPTTGRKYYLDHAKGKTAVKGNQKETSHVDVHRQFNGQNINDIKQIPNDSNMATAKRKYPLGEKLYVPK